MIETDMILDQASNYIHIPYRVQDDLLGLPDAALPLRYLVGHIVKGDAVQRTSAGRYRAPGCFEYFYLDLVLVLLAMADRRLFITYVIKNVWADGSRSGSADETGLGGVVTWLFSRTISA